jgi:aryl-alcohol dehydrogenase-like predicted oxidoreductase
MARYNASLAKEAVGEYVKVAEKHGLTPTQLALAWCNRCMSVWVCKGGVFAYRGMRA